MRRSSIFETEPDGTLDEHGFHHVHVWLTNRLGSQQIGASVYSTDRKRPTGPFHYHYGVEEWVYVIAGEPTLRDHDGQRRLRPGDLVCFPVGGAGAHTLWGPGRFVIFSTGTHREPWMSVYPDSDKVSGPEGILLASSRVDYWHGEGTWQAEPNPGPRMEIRELEVLPRQSIVNLDSVTPTEPPSGEAPPGFAARRSQLGPDLGAEMLGATLYEIDPGEGTAPYHYHSGREEWLLVLSGEPTVRHPEGHAVLAAGDIVCFPDGPAGAHRVLNDGSESARVMLLSTMTRPVTAHYPDSGKLLVRDAHGKSWVFREADTADYWEGEAGPR